MAAHDATVSYMYVIIWVPASTSLEGLDSANGHYVFLFVTSQDSTCASLRPASVAVESILWGQLSKCVSAMQLNHVRQQSQKPHRGPLERKGKCD